MAKKKKGGKKSRKSSKKKSGKSKESKSGKFNKTNNQNFDLEIEWKKLREKLESELNKDSEEVETEKKTSEESDLEQNLEEQEDEKFSQFMQFQQPQTQMNLQTEQESSAPVLRRIENLPSQDENLENLEDVQEQESVQEIGNQEPWQISGESERNEPRYTPSSGTQRQRNEALYHGRTQSSEPAVLRPRDTLPPEEIQRERLFEAGKQMAGRSVRNIYPDVIRPEQEEHKEKYYKLPEDS